MFKRALNFDKLFFIILFKVFVMFGSFSYFLVGKKSHNKKKIVIVL